MARLFLLLALLADAPATDHALLVGCTEYPHLREHRLYEQAIRLRGPENDVALLRGILVDHLGYDAGNVRTLVGWQDGGPANPTRANILAELDRLARIVKPGDRTLIHFAGHGSQQPDRSGDETDFLDEILLPADVKGWNGGIGAVENAISDDELAAKVVSIRERGATVRLILDCCHAGTLVRGASGRSRRIEPDLLGVPTTSIRLAGRRSSPLEDLEGVAALYASPSDRTAPELRLPRGTADAAWHGLLSYSVAAALRRTRGAVTLRELHAHVLAACQATLFHGATPEAEGDLDLRFLGGRAETPPLWVRLERDRIVLDAGRLTGIEEGTRLLVRESGGKALGEVEVSEARLTRSLCRAEELELAADRVYPAEVVLVPAGDLRLRIAVDGNAPEEVTTCLEREKARFLRTRDRPDWRLEVGEEGALTVRPARTSSGARFVVPPGELRAVLAQIFRVENLRRFASGRGPADLPPGLSMEMRLRGGAVEPGSVLRPGELFELVIRNRTGAAWDVTVFVLDSQYGIMELFPRHDSPRLDPRTGREVVRGPYRISDATQGVENLLMLAVPVEDVRETDLGWLARPPLDLVRRAPETNRVKRLLRAVAVDGRTRGLGSEPSRLAAALLTWRTEWGEVGPPAAFERPVAIRIEPPRPAGLIAGPKPPEAWKIGPKGSAVRTDPEGAHDVLLAGGQRPEQVLIDVDGNTPLEPGRLAEALAAGRFDPEIAIHFEAERRIAFYDRDDDGAFDLVLIDEDEDVEADVRFTRTGKGWRRETHVEAHWLCSAYLKDSELARRALTKLAILEKP
jgi:hypothetical protein